MRSPAADFADACRRLRRAELLALAPARAQALGIGGITALSEPSRRLP